MSPELTILTRSKRISVTSCISEFGPQATGPTARRLQRLFHGIDAVSPLISTSVVFVGTGGMTPRYATGFQMGYML